MQDALKAGNFIEGVSSVIDFAVNKATQAGIVDYNVGSIIKSGKDAILNNVENNLEKSFQEQYNSLDNINEAMNKWKKAFEKQIELANNLELPIVIHSRDAIEDTINILKQNFFYFSKIK